MDDLEESLEFTIPTDASFLFQHPPTPHGTKVEMEIMDIKLMSRG